jgi:hypothetical protein
MRIKRKIPAIFYILGIIFFILSMPISGALSTVKLDRTASARVVDDNKGALKLEGFQNKAYNMNHKYKQFGTITNNTMQIMKLSVVITPEIGLLNALSTHSVKIGNEEQDFYFGSCFPKQIITTISPGQTLDVSATLANNITSIKTSFQFTATNLDGSYTMQLTDSIHSPRNIICY